MPGTIYYIMGVSGSGKTVIGRMLAEKLHLPFFDADDYHPTVNKEKMKAEIPLTDEDRTGWLQSVHSLAMENSGLSGAVIACSALKEKYRQLLLQGILAPIHWIWLKGDYELIYERMQQRTGHYMPVNLLRSQFETLEPPAYAWKISIIENPETIVEELLRRVKSE